MEKFYYNSPLGMLEIICKNNEIISLKPVLKSETCMTETNAIKDIKLQLEEYFISKRKIFSVNINPSGTDFQKKVWKELLKIPYGETRTYSYIAEKIGNKNAQRAVGSACNKNPIMIIIPCHRVISKNNNISGYAYGAELKRRLLKLENYI